MGKSFYPDGLDWEADGYFAEPIPRTDPAFTGDKHVRGWLRWEDALRKAQQGDFSAVPGLLDVHRGPHGWVLGQCCAYLMGDAGWPPLYRDVAEAAANAAAGYVARIEYCGALAAWGSLSVVPTLLTTYLAIGDDFKDADIIPVYLTYLLEPEPGPVSDPGRFASASAYRDLVTQRYRELTDKFGTADVIVLRGERFGVVALARLVLRQLGKPAFSLDLRRQFEASTGIDCRAFYRDGNLQPLAAAAIVEDFLDGPSAEKYEDGARYFFEHRLPD